MGKTDQQQLAMTISQRGSQAITLQAFSVHLEIPILQSNTSMFPQYTS